MWGSYSLQILQAELRFESGRWVLKLNGGALDTNTTGHRTLSITACPNAASFLHTHCSIPWNVIRVRWVNSTTPLGSKAFRIEDQKDNLGRTPLHIAASRSDSGIIEGLLDYIPYKGYTKYIPETDCSGQTVHQIAAGEGHEGPVKMLLEKGSDPLKDCDGQKREALHHVALVEDPNIALATCKTLVENSTDDVRSLMLWASAIGLGTVDEMEDVHPHMLKPIFKAKRKISSGSSTIIPLSP